MISTTLVNSILSYGTLFSHIVIVFVVAAFIFRKSWGAPVVYFVGKHALVFGLMTALTAIVGSLVYSEIVGYEPCLLCWWQRVFIYPSFVLFLVAISKKDRNVFDYVLPLSVIAGIIGLYQSYVNLGGSSILPCTAAGSACSKVYVLEFGYITIPMMSLTIAIYLVVISIIGKYYAQHPQNDSNS
jgi:disulfide bond formation protein DsbB